MRFDRAVNMRRRLTALELAAQLGLRAGSVAAYAPRARRPAAAALVANAPPPQIAMELRPPPVWVDPDDIPEEGDFPEHRWTRAADCEPVHTRAAASIFAMAAELGAERTARQVISEFMLWPAGEPAAPVKPARAPTLCRRIVRDGDVTRHIALREQDTEEWAEKERQRRARQKPPRPQKQKFKMKGTREWADHQS